MALELTVNNVDEFQEMVDSKDFKISESIVNSILSNLNSKKNHIHILSVSILEDGQTLDITLERKFFIEKENDFKNNFALRGIKRRIS